MSVIGAKQDSPTPEQLNQDGQQETVTDLGDRPAADPAPQDTAPATPEGEKPKVAKVKLGGDFTDKRAAIGEKHETKMVERSEEFGGDFANLRSQAVAAELGEEPTEPAPKQAEQPATPTAPAQPAQPAAAEQMVELKVNGETRQVPLSQLIANAQMYEAGAQILAEAKALREDVKKLRGDEPAPEAHQSPAPGTSPVNAQSGQDQPRLEVTPDLKEIVRAIQMGDEEEAAEALLQFQRKAAALDPSNLATDVAQIVQLQAEQNSSAAAIENFQAHNPEFRDPIARQVGATMLIDEMRKDLIAAARARGTPESQIAQLTADDTGVRLAHERARAMRLGGFRSMDTLLNASRDAFHAWRGSSPQPQQAADPQNQFSRARSAAPQPAARSSAPALARPQAKPQTNAEIVAEIRQSRMVR